MNYYGRFYKSERYHALGRFDWLLSMWARRKYKRLRGSPRRAWRWLSRIKQRQPGLFAHWRFA
ncbi:MAG: hypothetical protein JSV14_01875 [Deltaproteobacteria bacterium]|nr:MAG: hypothetical protein JSV14_01875 [Deltaproteobacteria bacterium]